jgi:hypothetical protein
VGAAAITGGRTIPTMWQALKYALPAFLAPAAFVLTAPGEHLLGRGSALEILGTGAVACLGVAALAVATGGWVLGVGPAGAVERVLCALAGLLLLYLYPVSVAVGIGLTVVAVLIALARRFRAGPAPATGSARPATGSADPAADSAVPGTDSADPAGEPTVSGVTPSGAASCRDAVGSGPRVVPAEALPEDEAAGTAAPAASRTADGGATAADGTATPADGAGATSGEDAGASGDGPATPADDRATPGCAPDDRAAPGAPDRAGTPS